MKKFKKLNSRGFEHLSLIALFVVGFALVGVYLLVKSNANVCTTNPGSKTTCISASIPPPPTPKPAVTLLANNQDKTTVVSKDGSLILTWNTTNATSCKATGAWTGDKATSGAEDKTKDTGSISTRKYTLTCKNAVGEASVTRQVNIEKAAVIKPVSLDLDTNGQEKDLTVTKGDKLTLKWKATHATTCAASGAWTGAKAIVGTEDKKADTAAVGEKKYTLACTNTAGTQTITRTVKIAEPKPVAVAKPIVGVASNRCVDVKFGIRLLSAGVHIWDCINGLASQQWATEDKAIVVYGNSGNKMCLDVYGAKKTNGTPIITYRCHGEPNQQWTRGTDGTIKSVASGKCLDASGPKNGSDLIIWDCNGSSNQRWR